MLSILLLIYNLLLENFLCFQYTIKSSKKSKIINIFVFMKIHRTLYNIKDMHAKVQNMRVYLLTSMIFIISLYHGESIGLKLSEASTFLKERL